jgi:hypothetical protein
MNKVIGLILTVVVLSSLLGGCYSRSCDQPPPPMSYKGEIK